MAALSNDQIRAGWRIVWDGMHHGRNRDLLGAAAWLRLRLDDPPIAVAVPDVAPIAPRERARGSLAVAIRQWLAAEDRADGWSASEIAEGLGERQCALNGAMSRMRSRGDLVVVGQDPTKGRPRSRYRLASAVEAAA